MGLLSRVEDNALESALTKAGSSLKDSGAIIEKITQFHENCGHFNCILFDIPGHAENENSFCQSVTKIIGNTGTVIPLPAGRPLILLPLSADRELIVHRLSKSLDAAPLLSFEADGPDNVINRINSLP